MRNPISILCLFLPAAAAVDLAAQAGETGGEVFELSPFEVNVEDTAGYYPTTSVVASGFRIENVKNPINIASLSKELVSDLKFDDLADAVGYISGAQKSPSSDGTFHGSRITVRGFDTSWFNRNGVRRYVINGVDNLDRLEVIKGPAAVFFGQASPGGVVNYVTKRPSFAPLNAVNLRYGSYDYTFGEAESQGPVLGSQQLAYRVDATWLDKGDWRDFEWQERTFVYGGLLWQPVKKLKLYAEYERIKDENNDALGLPQGNPDWIRDFYAVPDAANEVTNFYAANPTRIGLPASATRDQVVTRLQGRWRASTSGSPEGSVRWRDDSAAAWQALGHSREEIAARFPLKGRILPDATPYGWEWNNLGPGGWVKHDIENITIEAMWDVSDWMSLRSAVVYDNSYRTAFLSFNQLVGVLQPDGALLFPSQKLTPQALGNESMSWVNQAVFSFTTGAAQNTLLLGADYFDDHFLIVQPEDESTTTPAALADWNYAANGYPEQSSGDLSFLFIDPGTTGERLSYTGNYILRLWDSRVVGMAGIRRETFKAWSQYPDGANGERELGRDITVETPSFGVVLELAKGLNLFGSLSESYNANGLFRAEVNQASVPALTDQQKEEFTAALGDDRWQAPMDGEGFDIGLKTDWRDNTISGTLSYFEVVETGRSREFSTDLTLADPINVDWLAQYPTTATTSLPIQRYELLGESRVRGMDLDLSIVPTRNWMVLLSYAYMLEAERDSGGSATIRIKGVPRHSYSVWSKYTFREGPLAGLSAGFGLNGKSGYTLSEGSDKDYYENGFIVFDAMLEYRMQLREPDDLRLGLNIKNILDERYFAGGAAAPGDARKILFSVSYRL